MSNQTGGKRSNEVMMLERRIAALEAIIRRIPSRFGAGGGPADAVRIRIEKTAHGLTVGQWVRPGGFPVQWVAAIAKPLDLVTYAEGNLPILAGVVSRVFNADAFEITVEGYVEGINNPEDTVDGEFLAGVTYSLSEVDAGVVTKNATTTRIECFMATDAHAGIVLQQTKCQAQLMVGPGGHAAGVVLDGLGDPADASTPGLKRSDLRVVINDYSAASDSVVCRGGIVVFPIDVVIPGSNGEVWLDPTTPGGLTDTKPTTPADQRPFLVMTWLGGNVYWVFPPDESPLGVGDLWDVDLDTPPADDQLLVWVDADKRWRPAKITGDSIEPGAIAGAQLADFLGYSILGNPAAATASAQQLTAANDGDVLRRVGTALGFGKIAQINIGNNAVGAAQLTDALACTVLGNGTASTGDPNGITASTDGQVLNRKAGTLSFTSVIELGTNASGGGQHVVYFGAGIYCGVTSFGFDFYLGSNLRVQMDTSGRVIITWPSSNTVTFDPADVAGTGRQFKIRELDICDATGAAKKVQGLFTALY